MAGFIDTMRAEGYAVESICRVLREQGRQVAARTYRAWRRAAPAVRTITDAQVIDAVRSAVWTAGCSRAAEDDSRGSLGAAEDDRSAATDYGSRCEHRVGRPSDAGPRVSREMPCSAQKVVTAPRGASGGHCVMARRTRGSTGSTALMPQTMRGSVRTKHPRRVRALLMHNCQRCPDT